MPASLPVVAFYSRKFLVDTYRAFSSSRGKILIDIFSSPRDCQIQEYAMKNSGEVPCKERPAHAMSNNVAMAWYLNFSLLLVISSG
jgi:hypothetical protein